MKLETVLSNLTYLPVSELLLLKNLAYTKNYFALITELCFRTQKEKFSERYINLIRDKFNEIKDELKQEKIFEMLKDKWKDSLWLKLRILEYDRKERDKKEKEGYFNLIHECEEVIRRGDLKEFKRKIINLYEILSPLFESSKWGYKDPEIADIETNMRILELLAQIENVCLVLKRSKDFDINIERDIENLVEFTKSLKDLCKNYVSHQIWYTIKATDIPEDDSISCLLHLYRLYKSIEGDDVSDFLLLLSVTSEVLKNEGLSAKDLDKYAQTFKKVFKNVREKVSISREEKLKSLREYLVNYLSSALKVSRTFNIDNEMDYHAYIVSKFSSISLENFRKFTNLYKIIVDELVEKEYGRKYVLPLLRLTAVAIIQQIFYRMSVVYINSNFIQNLLKIINFVNEMCDEEVTKNFDKMLNYSIYFADLEYLDGFIDYLYLLYLQRNYEEFKNALKSLNL